MGLPIITLVFHGNLWQLLPKILRKEKVRYSLRRRASIKDIIESLGVPHTEVGTIQTSKRQVSFAYIPKEEKTIHIHPFSDFVVKSLPNRLWYERWTFDSYMVDVNALKLARNMRMAGIDTTIVPEMDVVDIALLAASEERVIVSRNRQLLKCAEVRFGQLLRSENHVDQLREVNDRFSLAAHLKPFSRCLSCNGPLESVVKKTIEHRLEPLTRRYYTIFKRCSVCEAIYWNGSHVQHMQKILAEIDWK